jgi:predicted SprT family Zn-dependent metalloprotease
LDEIIIYQHEIKLNRHFLLSLMGYSLPVENLLVYRFTFSKLLETIAEEVAHCLVREFYPNVEEHGTEFKEIKKSVLSYLEHEKIARLVKKELERNKIV